MNKRIGIFLSLLTLATPKLLPAAEGLTLAQCFKLAQNQSESLKIQMEEINKSSARGRAALGGAMPDVRWKFDNTWNDPSGVKALEAQGFTGFVEKEQTESKFTLEQPLFSGLREWTAWSGAKRERLKNELLLERASLDLYEDVSEIFYSILDGESNRGNTKAALILAENRVRELKGFSRLGKARKSEVFTAEAHAAALKADLVQIESMIKSFREELSYLAGQDLTNSPLLEDGGNISEPMPLSEALTKAQNRSDLKAQKEDMAVQKLRVRYERGFFWPSIDVFGNYYTQRSTFLDEIDWDIVLSVDMPLFQGGSVRARVREAQAGYRQAQLKLSEMERHVQYSVRKIHSDLLSALQQTRSLEEATLAAQKSYDALQDEYKLGLVTNLDVLQAMDFLLAQKRARDTARLKSKHLFVSLDIAMETLP